MEAAEAVYLPVPPLHGILILKLISWDDKKPGREKDLEDIAQILKHAWEFVEDEAYENHLDVFNNDFTTDIAAARILGRQIAMILARSEVLRSKMISILQEQTQAEEPGLMLRTLARFSNKPTIEIAALINEILSGIRDHPS